MIWRFVFLSTFLAFSSCIIEDPMEERAENETRIRLHFDEANILSTLPLKCVDQEYPNKLNQVIGGEHDLRSPKQLHPAFYGCFDWHSSVHGHWSIVRILSLFPNVDNADSLKALLLENLTAENIEKEVKYFDKEINSGFERSYGWAWLLKLDDELATWRDPIAPELSANLRPLTKWIEDAVLEFLPKLEYPIRAGTHTNTAFAFSLIYDHASRTNNKRLLNAIVKKSLDFYSSDTGASLKWEPSGYDFLSPTLEEANLMRRVLAIDEYRKWLNAFLPELANLDFTIKPAIVTDRKDGHIVHLDGLNFSRAWCLHGIAETLEEFGFLSKIGNDHIQHSLPSITDGNYEGGHWLGSFALLSLSHKRI